MDKEEDSEATFEYFQQRFREHKLKAGVPKRSNKPSVDAQGRVRPVKSNTGDFRVDHKNLPIRWKDQRTLKNEQIEKSRNRLLRMMQPVKSFPGQKKPSKAALSDGSTTHVEMIQAADVVPSDPPVSQDNAIQHLEAAEFLYIDQSQFPLDMFDNEEFERHTPEEWLALSRMGKALYYVKGEWRWRPCKVLEYNENTQKYRICFQGSVKEKWIRRINLQFDEDDPDLFAQRLEAASTLREKTKGHLRLDHFIQNQPSEEVRPMSSNTLEGIHEKVVGGLPIELVVDEGEPQAILLRTLTDDVIEQYAHSMKKAVVEFKLKDDSELRQRYDAMKLPSLGPLAAYVEFGKVAIPEHAFSAHQKKISALHYTSRIEFLSVLVRMYNTWHTHYASQRYVCTDLEKIDLPCDLYSFQQLQSTTCTSTMKLLKDEWRRSIMESLIDSLQDIFDFFQSDPEIFRSSPICKLFKSMETRMNAQVRYIVQETIHAWVQFVSDRKINLFAVQLVSEDGAVELLPSLTDIQLAMRTPLEEMTDATQDLNTVDAELMSLLQLDKKRLFNLNNNDPEVAETDAMLNKAFEEIEKMVTEAIVPAQDLAKRYEQYAYLENINVAEYVVEFRTKTPSLEDFCGEIRKFHQISSDIDVMSYDIETFSLVCVNTQGIKLKLQTKANEIKQALIQSIVDEAHEQNTEITRRYQAILERINEKPTNEAELAKLKEFVNSSKSVVDGICDEVREMHARLDALNEFSYHLPESEFTLAWSTMEWPLKVNHAANTCDSELEEDKIRMMDKLATEKEIFEQHLDRYEVQVSGFKSYGDIDQTDKYVELAVTLYDHLVEAKVTAEDFNSRDAVFGFPPTEYSILDQLQTDFALYYKLWTMCSDFNISKQSWLNGSFLELNGADIERNVTEWWKTSYKLSKSLADEAPGSAEVALVLRERTGEFRAYLPIIQALASPALNARHWVQLSEKIGQSIENDDELTLQHLIDTDIINHIDEIQAVCVIAEKEYSLEKSLKGMINEWEAIEIECLPYRETGTYLVKSVDDIVTLLDDHIVKTQTMRGSPFIKPNEKECRAWEKKLQYSQHLIDEWMNCQRTWLYLEPIFGSEDIMRQMPAEARRFASVDALWRKTLEDTVADPIFMNVIAMDKLLQKFQKANEKLDEIQKGLNDYLEMKRLYFPRFFFLSNDELLEILSQTKEPRAVQPHLGKCFEGVNKVTFTDKLLITEMISAQGEKVVLQTAVDPESGKNKGNVEMWLLELEERQWESIRDHTLRAIETYPSSVREEWVLQWPAQVVLAASQVYWTQDVTRAIQQAGTKGLSDYITQLNAQLDRIVLLVRGNLTKLERTTIGALVVIDVHARDTIAHMISVGIEHDQDFEWISQFRYYCQDQHIQARIVNAKVQYGYEYLGNTMRLVITPLTDRCYRTMMGAVDLLYGGAPEGPAGTGKTETVKDLSKAIAIQCVVFNCSDGLDYLAMAKFFKGLAGCGSWCCFDEFNRINIEVLSVIAQQILTINEGKKQKVDKFQFEGTYIKLNPSANVFITMNPGYAGRAELPDNLKALFRPCAMMVPDYALIAEIRLYSFGFSEARSNARKLTQVLLLASEQLSSQKHYDYGMRAVNSILVAAGNLRQTLGNDPFWTEDKIVLRSVQDVNLPKFTTDDLPLFQGITSDLFPDAQLPNPDHGDLIPCIEQVCDDGISIVPETLVKLEKKPAFLRKIIQLYETVLVRHGLMVVGQTGSGKSCIVHTLAKAMTIVAEQSDGKAQRRVHIHTINPKSITSGQLYGNFDENTHEWSDGVLACTYRNCARDTTPDRQWVMFDGPVDAVWIENMNTVLDDNKKLCLMSGEIVKMTDQMTMMFETEDLEEASPATVSRVGMVFLEPKNLGWRPLVNIWLAAVPDHFAEHSDFILALFEWLVPPLLFFVEKSCKVPTPVTFLEHVSSLIRLYSCFLDFPPEQAGVMTQTLEALFMKALIWSLGACVDSKSRVVFDQYLRALIHGDIATDTNDAFLEFTLKNRDYAVVPRKAMVPFPEDGSVYDFDYHIKKGSWVVWMDDSAQHPIPRDALYTSILVPTIDTVRNAHILDTLITHRFHVLCTGDTGTGKSVSIKQKLVHEVGDEYMSILMNFSAQTSANQTQDIIESKLDKRRKGVLGPALGKRCIIFVDDLNMPAKETYGAQPPIEILRQWMGHGGWYNRKENALTLLTDIQFIAAMGHPGGGRTRITQRYVRYFNVLNFIPFDGNSLHTIFARISTWFLSSFTSSVKDLADSMVDATIDIYDTISAHLLPTPAKSHYTFNLRDLSKVFQGIAEGNADQIKQPVDLIRLWSHECLRVFHDRLVDEKDREWFKTVLTQVVERTFKLNYVEKVRGSNPILIYGNFGDPKANIKTYSEIPDHQELQTVMEMYLDDYNNMTSAPMSLVLFQNAIEHIARISRVIHQPYGNALLVGVGGSGRKSLTSLAVFMAEYQLFQIEISKSYNLTDWREDLKKVLQLAGIKNQPTVFLFSDTQIVQEAFVEDINGILNTGEVANLWNNEELMQLNEAMEASAQSGNWYSIFVDRCRTNLHVVLALSPIGEAFRRRLRMFPSLVNCCTIDWFTEWPDEALRSVANHFLIDIDLAEDIKHGVVDICVDMQKRVSEMSVDFLQSLRRHYYVTPTSYLELISTFKKLLSKKRTSVKQMKDKYDNGLTKLVETAKQVAQMQVDLEELQPMLKSATLETDELLVTIEREQKDANVTKELVAAEEKVCNAQAAEANEMKTSCESELAEAIPALENAMKALKTLTKGDITEVKAMKKPPDGVKIVMETVCIMMGVAPVKIKDPNGGTKKIDDYWGPSQKNLLNDTRFLQNLLEFDKDNIDPAKMAKIIPYTEKPDFTQEKIKKASVAASGLCCWIHAMVVYDRVVKVVAPKRIALAEATEALAAAQATLKVKQDALDEILAKLQKLQGGLDAANQKKLDLQNQVNDCSAKLARANQLIGGLGGERIRWNEMSGKLQEMYENVTGDILLSSGVIAYLGSFTSSFRQQAVHQWSELMKQSGITCSKAFELTETLGDPVKIRTWTIAKLPNDSFSIDNAIMLSESNRWPLMIDPQGQANQWIKNMEGADLKCIKQTQATFVRNIENSIAFGHPVLIENVSEEIDPILEPILLKQIIRLGGGMSIRLGDNTVEYDPNFKLYMTTTLRNPHYSPETCVKVNLLNFMATEEGLEDQMLGIVVAKEEPALEAQREKLVLEDAENKKILSEIEDKILHLLQTVQGNILDDETLIETLAASKVTANKIEEKVREAAITQKMIAEKRQGYKPVAFRASQLFFCIADLAGIDPMYQYALDWFISLFVCSIERAEKANDLSQRMINLNDTFTFTLYVNVCRSLFEKDKLLFSFLLTVKILVGNQSIEPSHVRYFLAGNTAMELSKPNPAPGWLPDKLWKNIVGLDDLPRFNDFSDSKFSTNLPFWETCLNSNEPIELLQTLEEYGEFEKLLLLRCFRPDKVIPCVMSFVSASIGKRFIEPQPFDLMAGYNDSNCATPLIFVLTPGADPMSELLKLANELGFHKKFVAISLGQGQGPLAENAVAEAIDNGTWVCLQNCHLSISWLPTLERICEDISPDIVHANFRLWLTSEPCGQFPPYILQHGVKMTNEPPKGMRANLKGSYLTFEDDWLESCARPQVFKKLLFGLCFFHATVRERTKFGPLGWNIKYVFSSSDLNISRDQLKIFLDDLDPKDPVPYEALAYLAGECNYGGRVTDDKDRRCIINILSDFYTPSICLDDYKFSPSGVYFAPPEGQVKDYVEYINSLPMNEGPEIFGLHENANISCAIAETNLLLDSALSLQPRSSNSSGKSWDETLAEAAADISSKLPSVFDIEKAELDFPVMYSESMNTVLTQELIRFNRLIEIISTSLIEVQRALKGLVVMSGELEAMGDSMVNGQVPEMWSNVAYPSLKPLGSWVSDFLARLTFLQDWIDRGTAPNIYWISGFFFTQAFITGTLQNFARKHVLPIDQVGYDMKVLTKAESQSIQDKAPDGAYITGLFMEGARWDNEKMVIAESKPRELHISMPIILLLPKSRHDIELVKDTDPHGTAHVYLCPVYKTSLRQGTLSTTGHSTNFVMFIRIPIAQEHTQKHWIKRGVAMLTQLDT